MRRLGLISVVGVLGILLWASCAWSQSDPVPLVNSDAEAGSCSPDGLSAVEIPGWTVTGSLTVVAYGTPGAFPSAGDVSDPGTTRQLFVGGSAAGLSTATQTASIPQVAWERIDSGVSGIGVRAHLGGWQTDADSARLVVTVLNVQSAELQVFVVGPVTAADRGGATALKEVLLGRSLQTGARSVRVRLEMYGVDGPYNNAFADDIQVSILFPDPVQLSTWGSIKAREWDSR